jgi:hypothetical protein
MSPARTGRNRRIFDGCLQSNLSRHGCGELGGCLHDQARNQSTSSHEPQGYLGPPYVHTSITHLSVSPTYLRWPRCVARRNLGVRVSSWKEATKPRTSEPALWKSIMLKNAIACALGAALLFLGALGFAEGAPPSHQGRAPINWQSTGNEVEKDGQANQDRLSRLVDEENRLLDRELQSICRGC